MRAGAKTQCFFPSYLDQSVVKIRPSALRRRNVGVPGMGTTMLTVATSTQASSRKSAVRRKIPGVVLVEPEHDPQVDRDPLAMKAGDETAVVVDSIVRLVRPLEALLGDRLQAQEERLAAAPGRQRDELLVPHGVAVHWLVHHFRSGVSALNSSFA